MKKLAFLFVICCAVSVVPLQAQVVQGALIFGGNLSQLHGDDFRGWNKIGLNVGASAIIPLGERWSVSIQNLFSQKGSYQKEQFPPHSPDDTITGQYNLRLNYVEVPVLVHYRDKGGITLGLGFSFGRLVGFKEIEQGGRVKSYADLGHPFSDNDYNAIVDIWYQIWKKLKLDVCFSHSLVKIRERDFIDANNDTFTFTQYNRVLSFRLIYVFNEKPAPVKNDE